MKQPRLLALGVACAVGFLSGCGGSDNVPIIPPSGPAAAVDDQRVVQSDALTSEEAALVSQANSDPDPAPKADL